MIKLKLYDIISTWFYSGYLKPASGTWGTLASLPFCLYVTYNYGIAGIIIASIGLFAIGLWAAHQYELETGRHDSSHVVIDETVGMLIACIPLVYVFNIKVAVLCFVIFRLFDAVKIGPVGWLDKHINGAFGVMIDDVAAGLMTIIIILGYLVWMH